VRSGALLDKFVTQVAAVQGDVKAMDRLFRELVAQVQSAAKSRAAARSTVAMDSGAPARCTNVLEGKPGLMSCVIGSYHQALATRRRAGISPTW